MADSPDYQWGRRDPDRTLHCTGNDADPLDQAHAQGGRRLLREPHRMGTRARGLLADEANTLVLSAATPWELGIKVGRGKLSLPGGRSLGELVRSMIEDYGAKPLPIRHQHALRVATLPDHHRDPFDRILIAQAMEEPGMRLMTADGSLREYAGVKIEWAR